jgi:hypothetical protein
VFGNLTQDELATLLGFVRDWNTNSRNRFVTELPSQRVFAELFLFDRFSCTGSHVSFVAQSILGVLLKHYTVSTLAGISSISSILQALLPYTGKLLWCS